MKNIIKTFLVAIVFVGLWSCEDEQDLRFLESNGDFQILTPLTGETVVLNAETPLNPGLVLAWEDMDYGTPTQINYTVQIAQNGTDFESPIDISTTSNTFLTINSGTLNAAVVGAGLPPFSQGAIDVRVKSSIGSLGEQEMYSNTITYLVTPYSTDLPRIAVPGNHQGWNPPTAPRLASSGFGETDYEGYVWLDGGYKFLAPDGSGNFNWGNTDWGDDGSFSGALVESGESDCTATPGYYRVQANTSTLTYSTTPTVWGIIGAATPGGWDNSTVLTYNSSTQKWEGVVVMTAGPYKFRANNAWTINLGGSFENLTQDGPDITLDADGTYLVELDLSNPREYMFTLTAQ